MLKSVPLGLGKCQVSMILSSIRRRNEFATTIKDDCMKRVQLLKLLLGMSVVPFASSFAADGDVTATAGFRVAITVTATQVLAFNATGPRIEFTGTPDTSELRVYTDGTRTETGAFYILPGTGTATPGILQINAAPAETVNIACDDTAILGRTSGGQTLILSGIEIDTTGGVGTDATDCAVGGLTSPVIGVLTIPGGGTANVHVGGRIVANSGSGVQNGDYSTANAGGDPVTLRVLYN